MEYNGAIRKMKKVLLALAAVVLFATTSNAQSSYFDFNLGYSQDNTLDEDYDLQIKNLSIGYNTLISNDLYLGASIGYSMIGADNDNNEVNIFTLTPRVTYQRNLAGGFYWTPSFYVTAGYGQHDLGTAFGVDLGSLNYLNFRIGANLLSFDYKFSKNFAINLNVLTPYYNIMKVSYSENDNFEGDYDGFVYLGGTVGVKFSL